jgi:hypothetical protein
MNQVLIKIEEKEKPDSDDIFEDMSPKVKKVEFSKQG